MTRLLFGFVTLLLSFTVAAEIDTSALKKIPIQEGGRVKPYDTFAREALLLIYGKSKYEGGENKRPAHEIVFTWFLLPEPWANKKIVQLKHAQLKESLNVDKKRSYFSPNELFANDRLSLQFQELGGRRQAKEKLDPYFQAVQRLENQLGVFRTITAGDAFRVFPVKDSDKWLAFSDEKMPEEALVKFQSVTRAFVKALGIGMQESASASEQEARTRDLENAVDQFMAVAQTSAPDKYEILWRNDVEIHYNSLDPFMWSWILYLLGVILLSFAWYSGGKLIYQFSWAVNVLGFLMHTYGFVLRVIIAERPPVSNMYETVIWVSWGGILFAMIIEAVYKQRFILLCGGIGAIMCLVLASIAPTILDPSINPLEPVLVSNFWLLIHVLTITISYSAFLLAFVLGDIGLALAIANEDKNKQKIQSISNAIYRSIQIGVVLLAAGTILGGIWADYSWGRFWGWDPKETWALIALLGYLAILHGRLVGWIRPFGMCASAIACFSLVIMAWYGVNFVLGAGLHSYGFGGGGIEYVSSFVGIHFIYIIYAMIVRQKNVQKSANS